MAANSAGRPPERLLLELLGLAARARRIVAGTDQVRVAVRAGTVVRVLLAADSSPAQQGKLIPLLEARGVPYHVLLSRGELGSAIGRGAATAVGIEDENFARRVAELAAALSTRQE